MRMKTVIFSRLQVPMQQALSETVCLASAHFVVITGQSSHSQNYQSKRVLTSMKCSSTNTGSRRFLMTQVCGTVGQTPENLRRASSTGDFTRKDAILGLTLDSSILTKRPSSSWPRQISDLC